MELSLPLFPCALLTPPQSSLGGCREPKADLAECRDTQGERGGVKLPEWRD